MVAHWWQYIYYDDDDYKREQVWICLNQEGTAAPTPVSQLPSPSKSFYDDDEGEDDDDHDDHENDDDDEWPFRYLVVLVISNIFL